MTMTDTAHMDRVRDAYERTKADHALPYGCNVCTRGFVEARAAGWDYDPDGTPALCLRCAQERRRWEAQMAAEAKKPKRCPNNHDLVEGNIYRNVGPSGNVVRRCLQCRRDRGKRRDMRVAAEKKAAQ